LPKAIQGWVHYLCMQAEGRKLIESGATDGVRVAINYNSVNRNGSLTAKAAAATVPAQVNF
jgi:hypothetical protein